MKCEICGKEVHYCSSCDTDLLFESEFCSEKCLKESGLEKRFVEKINKVKENEEIYYLLKDIFNDLDDYPILYRIFDEHFDPYISARM